MSQKPRARAIFEQLVAEIGPFRNHKAHRKAAEAKGPLHAAASVLYACERTNRIDLAFKFADEAAALLGTDPLQRSYRHRWPEVDVLLMVLRDRFLEAEGK